jgi:hypothetical protein
MTPHTDSFPDPLSNTPLPLDSALETPSTLAADAADTERLTLGERLVISVSAFFSTLADRSHMAESPAFFETGRLSTQCVTFRRDPK